MMISGEGPLLAALRNDPALGPRAAKIISGVESFNPESEDDAKTFYKIFSMMFSDDTELGLGARNFLTACEPRPPVSFMYQPEITNNLNPDGNFHRWMIDQLAKDNSVALEAWSIVIRLCGNFIHSTGTGTTILNSLLQIVEKAFKQPHNEVRKSAFKCWIALMDNFAENPAILSSNKRIKLITRPLIGTISQRSEEQIRNKFDAWWHYLGLFKEQLAANVESVVLPFLQFCYLNIGTGQSPGQSPAKKFTSLRALCLEAMAILVSGPNHVKASQVDIGAMLDCLKDGSGVIKAAGFVKQHQILLSCTTEAFSMMRFNAKIEVGHMTEIWLTLGTIVKDLCMVSSELNKEAVHNFLHTSQNLLVTLERQLNHEDFHSGAVSLALTILECVSKLPTPALVCRKMTPPRTDPLSVVMIEMMLRPNLASKITSDADLNKYTTIFERFADPFGQQRLDGISVFHQILNLISGSNGLKITHVATLWKIIARFFEQHLFKFDTVNQAKNNLEMDLSACECVLLFPFKHFVSLESRQVWNQWSKLFKQFVMSAATSNLYQELYIEDYLASRVVSDLHGKLASVEEFANLSNLWSLLAENFLESLKAQSQTSGSESLPTFDNWKAIAHFWNSLATLTSKMAPEKSPPGSFVTLCEGLAKQMFLIIESASDKHVFQDLIIIVAPGMAHLIENKQMTSFGPTFQNRAVQLFERTATALQARLEGSFSLDFLKSVQPLIVVALSHPKQKISNPAQTMWNLTWAKSLPSKSVPSEISVHLKDSDSFTDLLSSSGSQDTPPVVVSTPTSFRSSFLERLKQNESPKFLKPSSATKKPSATKSLFGLGTLEDENSSDFVKISPASKKRRPLTEHQKEKLTSRSDDIPALYSEVSRDEMPVKLPSVFDSQLSIDESSMMAVDASDVTIAKLLPTSTEENVPDEVTMASSHESKRKQPNPHKNTQPVKKRGRKRKLDDDVDTSSSSTSVTSSQSKTAPKASPATSTGKRGRPPKKRAVIVDADTNVAVVNATVEKSVAPSMINSQLTNAPQVNVSRLEVSCSPVKILQENPLLVVPTPNSMSVARKINFPGDSNDNSSNEKVPASNDDNMDDNVDFIESSQSFDTGDAKHRTKRKRKSVDLSADTKPLLPRPSSRRSAILLQFMSGNSSGETKTGSSTLAPVSGKENNAPDKDAADNVQRNQYGETELHTAVKRKNLDRVRQLLDAGFCVNVKDHFGWTPLHESLNDDPTCVKIMKMLVGKGADVNAKASNGTTPLHDAVQLTQEVIDFLIDNGADPDIKNDNGKSAKDLAPERFAQRTSEEVVCVPDTEDLEADLSTQPALVADEEAPKTELLVEEPKADAEVMEVDQQTESGEISQPENPCVEMTPEKETKQTISTASPINVVEKITAPATALDETPTKPLIKPPLPFSSSKLSRSSSTSSLSIKMSRGARFVEMSKAKSSTSSPTTTHVMTMSPSFALMSPKPEAEQRTEPREEDLMTTPTQTAKPWQKYAPSPMDASPGGSILKRASSEKALIAVQEIEPVVEPANNGKIRRVHFPENPVSDQVEIPRCPSGKATRQRLNDSKFNQMFLPKNQLKFNSEESGNGAQRPETDSIGSYEATPVLESGSSSNQSVNCIYPALINCDEPLFSIMPNLANRAWVKAAERSLNENCIFKISDLAKLSKLKACAFDKFLKAPDSVTTIREALRKFEKTLKKREAEKHGLTVASAISTAALITSEAPEPPAVATAAVSAVDDGKDQGADNSSTKKTGIASIVEESTPEEEDEAMRQIYLRPSPSSSPTDGLSNKDSTLDLASDSESLVNPILTQYVISENVETSAAGDTFSVDSSSSNDVLSVEPSSQNNDSEEPFEQDGQQIVFNDDVDSMAVDDRQSQEDFHDEVMEEGVEGLQSEVENDFERDENSQIDKVAQDEIINKSDDQICSSQEGDSVSGVKSSSQGGIAVQSDDGDKTIQENEEMPDYEKWLQILKRRNSKAEVLGFVKKLIDLTMDLS